MKRFLLILLPVFLWSQPSKAEVLTLEQALSQAIDQTPAMAHVARKRADRDARAYELDVLQNPEVQVDNTFGNSSGGDGISLELTQPLRMSNFKDRPALAEAVRHTASLEEQSEILSIQHDVTRRYLDLWQLQQHARFLRENLAFAKGTNAVVRKAALSGELAISESYLFDAETLKFQEELNELEATISAQQVDLMQKLGLQAETLTLAHPQVPQVPDDIEPLKALAKASPKQILLAKKREAERRLSVAKSDARLPEISPRFLYNQSYNGGGQDVGFGVRLTIPLWNKNEAEISRAKAEKRFAETSLATYDRVGYDKILSSQYEKATAAIARLKQYENSILPAYQKSYAVTHKMFRGGQASTLQLWQVHERLHDAQLKTLEIHNDAFEAIMALEMLLGQSLMGSS